MITVNIEQGSPEWFAEKAGKPSASNFDKIVTTKGEPSKSSIGYMYQLAAEAITGQVEHGYTNPNMEEGIRREEESRNLYEMMFDFAVKQVGFVYPDEQKKYGCSPDGIIENSHGLEMKNVLPKTQVAYLLNGGLPTDYFQQVHGSMLVTGFGRWDFMSYSPGLKPFILHVERDEKFISKLKQHLDDFCGSLAMMVKKIREMK
uniref:Putative exonuclease n=1 Tax=viral metagenome TaxID=1070528 RepID=A0A6H1ZG50_9ZZZZ